MASEPSALASHLRSPHWRLLLADVLEGPQLRSLDAFLRDEEASGAVVLPARERVFSALDQVEPEAVRVVILGQDPYPTPGVANGLAFASTRPGRMPASLRNILREVQDDLGVSTAGASGDLTPWARQGVLLLNTVLTVRAGAAGSHRRRGWEGVTEAILRIVAAGDVPRVFLLWGAQARKRKDLIGAPHLVLEAGHPSPLSVRHFRGCRHFSRTNDFLGSRRIDWRLPEAGPCRRG